MIISIHLLLRSNVCNDLAEAMKALDGKNQRLDSIADQVEIERLFGLHVLLEGTLPADAKCLSTRFVRTWREKKDDAGNTIWLRRSRLVGREYTWLQPDREALFSPASSNIATRILPIGTFVFLL